MVIYTFLIICNTMNEIFNVIPMGKKKVNVKILSVLTNSYPWSSE